MHQSARWLDEPTKPLAKYRFIDQLSTWQLGGVGIGLLSGVGVAAMTPALGVLRLSLGLIVAALIGGLLAYLASGRKEPYMRQVCGYAIRVSLRRMRVYVKRPSMTIPPTIDDAGIVESED